METFKLESLLLVYSLHIVVPVDIAKVDKSGAYGPVVVNLVYCTKVESHTKSANSGTVDINIVYIAVCALIVLLVFFFLFLICKSLHRHVGKSLARHSPLVLASKVGT